MSFIRTLTKDIDPKDLGFTYSHEHIVCCPQYWADRGVDDLLLDDPAKSQRDVQIFKDLGGNSIVDATAVDYGRNVAAVNQISQATGVQIIGTAGFNKGFLWNAKRPDADETYEEWISRSTVDQLTDYIVNEVENGMNGTNFRAGQIKFGTGYNAISPLEEKTIRAAAQAHFQTKAPLHSHTEGGTMALEQIEILKQEGVDLRNLSIAHLDRNPDTWMHLKVAETGAYLSFDGIDKIKYYPESVRINCILELVRHGHQKQIMIGGDMARKSYYASYKNGPGLGFIIGKWVPRFKEEANAAGFDGDQLIEDFFINNPKNCFSFKV